MLWEPDATPVIAPGETKTITARYDAPGYAVVGVEHSAFDQGGNDRTSSVTVTATYYAQRADLVVANSSALQVIVRPLRIVGQPVVGGPEIEELRTSADDGANGAWWSGRGDRTLSLRGNVYIQEAAHAGTLAQFLLDRCEYPRLTAQAALRGVPELRLGDRIQITDGNTMSSAFVGYVTSIRWNLQTGGGFRQEIEAMQAEDVYPYDGQYFILGTHTFGSGKRVFY